MASAAAKPAIEQYYGLPPASTSSGQPSANAKSVLHALSALGTHPVIIHVHSPRPAARRSVCEEIVTLTSETKLVVVGQGHAVTARTAERFVAGRNVLTSGPTINPPEHILASLPKHRLIVVDLAENRLAGINFTAIDFETANPKRYSPCAIGLAKVRDGRIVHVVSALMKPPSGQAFSRRNIGIHGIYTAHVKKAPSFETVLPWLIEYAGDDPLVAHGSPVERSVIVQTSQHLGLPAPVFHYEDTVMLSRRLLPDLENHKLPTVAAFLNLPPFAHHDACADAIASAQILIALVQDHGYNFAAAGPAIGWTPPLQPW